MKNILEVEVLGIKELKQVAAHSWSMLATPVFPQALSLPLSPPTLILLYGFIFLHSNYQCIF